MPALTPSEIQLIARLRSPLGVQRYLDRLPYNYELGGASLRTFRGVQKARTAHCLEAAIAAAAILEHHGHAPLLLDLRSKDKLDHVLFLFRAGGRWGAVGRSRDPGLHGRKPVFRTVEALVQSYVLPFIDLTGRITGWSVYELTALRRCDWRLSERNVWAVEQALIANRGRRLHTSDSEYARWHQRYLEHRQRFPDDKPVYYPGRQHWLSSGPG